MNKIKFIILYISLYLYNFFKSLFGTKYSIQKLGKYKIYKNYIKNLYVLSELNDNKKILRIVENNYSKLQKKLYNNVECMNPEFCEHCNAFSLYYINSNGKLVKGFIKIMFEDLFKYTQSIKINGILILRLCDPNDKYNL